MVIAKWIVAVYQWTHRPSWLAWFKGWQQVVIVTL